MRRWAIRPSDRAAAALQVLIFSQMTKMLDLLHYYLEERGFDPCRIDGSIPWEERMVRGCPSSCHHLLQVKLTRHMSVPACVPWARDEHGLGRQLRFQRRVCRRAAG